MVGESFIDKLEKTGLDKCLYNFKKSINQSLQKNKPLILFGAGSRGLSYHDLITKLSDVKLLFCDNNLKKHNMEMKGVPIINFEELKNHYYDCDIIITTVYYDEIESQLIEHGLKCNIIEGFDVALIKFGYEGYYDLIKEYEEDFISAYNILADEYSKKVFIDRLNYCISGKKEYIIPLKSNTPQYFDEKIINICEDEVFIDGGAYTGDTMKDFLKVTNSSFRKAYCFEPEKVKHNEFLKKFSSSLDIELLSYGLWKEKTILRFNLEGSSGSRISEIGNIKIPVTSIDDFLKGESATFIKLDIEGAELEALEGASRTIEKYKPKLAVCVYHNPLDIVKLPLYIKKIVPEYEFYLRHYSEEHSETVLYAVTP